MEDKKQDIAEVYDDLKKLSRDDLMKTYGFALGLSAKSEAAKATEVKSS